MSIVAINAKNPEEIRVATFNKHQVSDLYIENSLKKPSLKDIYAGVIRSIEPSLEAVFVEYGTGRHGFLQFKDVASEYCKDNNRRHLKSSLRVGQPIIVQVKKEEREGKGAALTTYITLPGTYLVLMPNHSTSGGVSKQIADDTRKSMQEIMNQLKTPPLMSVILRTAGAGRSVEDLERDLALLLKQWTAIKTAFEARKAPFLIFQEGDILARTIRDYTREDVTEIIVDDPEIFEKTKGYAATIRPELVNLIRLYTGRMPLFLHLGIEEAVESAFHHSVRLPSGGSIILDRAAAGVMIDVNSGSSTKHGDITETALKNNLEAAEMIAKQLRLRDLGGLILIDFIGMKEDAHKKEVEAKLWESIAGDRARIQIGHILPRFDVLVMSRQRLRASLGRVNEDTCLACQGQGIQRSVESLALSIIRSVEKKLFLKKCSQIRIEASVGLTTYLSNEKRTAIYELEKNHQFRLLIIPNPHWEVSQYKITGFSHEELSHQESTEATASYTLLPSEHSTEKLVPVMVSTSEMPAVERFTKQITHESLLSKFNVVKKVLRNIVPWGKEKARTVESSQGKGIDKGRRPAAQGSCAPRGRKPIRNAFKTNTRRESVAENLNNHTADKQVITKPVALPDVTPVKKLLKRNTPKATVSADIKKPELEVKAKNKIEVSSIDAPPPEPTLSSTRSPLKRSVVNRYGGEASVQKRGY